MPPENTGPSIADALKAVDGLKAALGNVLTLEQGQALQKQVADLTHEVKTLKAASEKAEKTFTVPAQCKTANLTAYKSQEDAYRDGQKLFALVHINEPKFRSPATAAALKWCETHGVITKGTNQVEGVNAQGGFLVYDQNSTEIIDLKEQYGVFEPNVRVIQMTSDHFTMNRRTGGTTVYPVDELGSITVSNKTWDRVTLTPKKFAQMTRWSSELNEDSVISVADDLAREFKYQFDLKKDQCGFISDGTSTYGGMQGVAVKINDGTHTASVVTAASGHTGFETLTLTDFHTLMGTLPLYARAGAKFYVSAYGFEAAMVRLAAAAGGNTLMNIGGSMINTFLGVPVVISQVLNSTAGADVSKIKLLYGNLPMSTFMGIRRGYTIATSTEKYFDTDELAIRATARWDINAHDLGTTSAAGPILALKTPAS
jgi:HK97 family phage major capsid protein